MNFKSFLALGAALAIPAASMALTPLWLRDVQISPDGKNIAFCYRGDIWTVPTAGGSAVRLTSATDYEANPVWSPDSKLIAYASDQNGNFDIYVIPADGGRSTRLTFDSSAEIPEAFGPDGKDVYFSAAIQDPAKSALFPSGRMTELYAVPVAGGASRQILGTAAQRINWGSSKADKGWFLYQDLKGFENEWRKHHTSSVTRDIWRYDAATGKHTNLTSRPGEDRDPVIAGDNVYFLSERDGGSMNVYEAPLSNMADAKAVTTFKGHPVRFLSRASDGVLCYAYDGEIYTQRPGGKPAKVNITVPEFDPQSTDKLTLRSGARGVAPSPDGKFVAFTDRGDVYVTSVEYGTTKQITQTTAAESGVEWAPDGKALYYVSERDGLPNIYKAELGYSEDPDFANATVIKETRMFDTDKLDRRAPDISPDGKQMAFIADRNKLMVMDLKTKKVRQLTDGSKYPSRSGGFSYQWSPDSKWISLEINDRKHDPYTDVALLNVADGTMTNLTNTGYFAEGGRFVLDGNAILYLTDRYGMRAHASWGSQMDAMLVFLNQDAYDRFMLSEEDYALRKEIDKKKKKAEGESDKDKKDKDSTDKKAKDIEVELDGIELRTVRLTPMSANISDAFITADGDNLYYIMRNVDGTELWKKGLRKDSHKLVAKVAGSNSISSDKDGKTLFLTGANIKKLDPKSDKITPVSYTAKMNLDRAAERDYMFDYVAREEGERFYNKGMHGVNWPELTKHYRKFMPHIANNYDFAELLSEMLGELNVSHTGGRYSHSDPQGDRTAVLGLLYDMTWTGDGFKVDEVLAGGPFDRADLRLKPGMIVKAINGNAIKAGSETASLFSDIQGRKTLVEIYDPATKETFSEVVIPVSKGVQNDLLYDRWVRQRAADVDRWSNGRLGYVHITSMNDGSFRKVYSDVLGKYNDRDGIVIDVRWNGGGRLHEDVEVFFTGQKYLTQEIRGVDACDMPSRRWNKPSIMVMSEACYSNAHGTPWVYKHQGIGKLVGAPVPGTMTSVNWVTMQDPSMVFGIPVIGYRTAEGTYLENSQLEPDIEVYNDPAVIVTGEDTQLRTAVQELLKDIDAKK